MSRFVHQNSLRNKRVSLRSNIFLVSGTPSLFHRLRETAVGASHKRSYREGT